MTLRSLTSTDGLKGEQHCLSKLLTCLLTRCTRKFCADLYFYIEWDEKGSSRDVVPAKKIASPPAASLKEGDECQVHYNKNQYPAKVLKAGEYLSA